jgi:hypothetical protein
MDIKKRLETIEAKFSNAEVTLWMASGSTRRVRVRRLVQMIAEIVIGGPIGGDTRAVIDSVRDNCRAVGEGRLPELLKALYAVRQPVSQTQTADLSKLSDEELAQLDVIFCKLQAEPHTPTE